MYLLSLTYVATTDCSPSASGTLLTDEWFSYSPRGEVTDVWEWTQHSGSTNYCHVSSAYWANGTLAGLGGNLGLLALAYGRSSGSGLDGEGRVAQVTANSGQSPLIGSVSYNVAGQPLAGTFGSGDSDGYGYDPNTGRQTSFLANVGGTNSLLSGTLSWNANGSLGTLALNYNGQGENCTYSHDDLSRVASVNCNSGSTWAQTFGYDAFGNVTKSGTGTWLPTYNQSTNRIQSIPGASVSYDANGNLLGDGVHSYTWDGNWGNPSAIDSVSLTYDALGRMVEQNRGGTYTQVVYSPSGAKLALMSGQTLTKAFVPLPGGGTAVYTGTGLAYYRHPDWLGSSRLATTPSQTVYAYTGYAPFGENYEGQGSTDLSFTGQNQDTVSGLDDFLYREYSPAQGRWTRPDPSGLQAVDTTNPQSWNRYAYVSNSPLASVDPDGLAPNPTAGILWGPLAAPAEALGAMCTLDGQEVPCEMVNAAMQSGGAAQCPGGECQRGFQQFYATLTDSGYAPAVGPNPFLTPLTALVATSDTTSPAGPGGVAEREITYSVFVLDGSHLARVPGANEILSVETLQYGSSDICTPCFQTPEEYANGQYTDDLRLGSTASGPYGVSQSWVVNDKDAIVFYPTGNGSQYLGAYVFDVDVTRTSISVTTPSKFTFTATR